jgi:hypothetical protein
MDSGKLKSSEMSLCHFVTTNPTRPDIQSNQFLRGERPTANDFSHDPAYYRVNMCRAVTYYRVNMCTAVTYYRVNMCTAVIHFC